MKSYSLCVSRLFCILLLFITFFGCGERWPTKDQTMALKGRWRLVSITGTDLLTNSDTTWVNSEGFLEFTYTKRPGAAPLLHSFAKGDIVKGQYSVFTNGKILAMYQEPKYFQNSVIALTPSSHAPFRIEGNTLYLEGYCSVYKKRELYFKAVFER